MAHDDEFRCAACGDDYAKCEACGERISHPTQGLCTVGIDGARKQHIHARCANAIPISQLDCVRRVIREELAAALELKVVRRELEALAKAAKRCAELLKRQETL